MRNPYLLLIVLAFALASCRKEYSGWNVYYNSKINLINTPKSDDCPTGGVLIQSGLDKNQNDKLDSQEVDQTQMVCNGMAGGSSSDTSINAGPRQIIIELNMLTVNMSSTTPQIVGSFPFFSKEYYPGYDSIVLVGRPYIRTGEINTATVDLYDLTNNRVIANSTLTSNKGFEEAGFVVSKNIYSTLPNEEISLGLLIRSGHEGMFAGLYALYLYLYRK